MKLKLILMVKNTHSSEEQSAEQEKCLIAIHLTQD